MNELINYTPREIFEILQINQDTWSKLDREVDACIIERNDSIFTWRVANDFRDWPELYRIQNELFDLTLNKEEWLAAVSPEKKKTVWELCEFIAIHAKKVKEKPRKIFGNECLSASIFLGLKEDLSRKGFDVRNLRPSSPISLFTTADKLSKFIFEVSKRGVAISDSIELKYKGRFSFLRMLNIFNPDRFYVYTGETRTFRDLTIRILAAHRKPI